MGIRIIKAEPDEETPFIIQLGCDYKISKECEKKLEFPISLDDLGFLDDDGFTIINAESGFARDSFEEKGWKGGEDGETIWDGLYCPSCYKELLRKEKEEEEEAEKKQERTHPPMICSTCDSHLRPHGYTDDGEALWKCCCKGKEK